MIWYRHWLEMRGGLVFLAVIWLFFGFSIAGPFDSLRWNSWWLFPWAAVPGKELTETLLGQAIGAGVLVWAEFAGRILPFVFGATIALAGNGIRSVLLPHDPSVSYTLTLPVSRTRLILTRLIAALVATVLAGLLAFAVGSAILLFRGYSIPLVPVAQSFALGVVFFVTAITVMAALTTALRGHLLGILGFMVLFASMIVPISYTVAAPARGEVPWAPLAAGLAIAALAFAFTVYKANARDY